jgi:hypothetical protein
MIGNDVARRAYEKAGFTSAEEKRDPVFGEVFGAPGMLRMTRRLGADGFAASEGRVSASGSNYAKTWIPSG